MLTQRDIIIIENLLNERLKFFPTKDELFKRLDHIVGELETIRNEQLLLTHSQGEHDGRLKALELIHPKGRHSAST